MSDPSVAGLGLVEVADRIWVARQGPDGATATLVRGASGVLVVDTLGNPDAAAELLDRWAAAAGAPVAVALTHGHPGHAGGLPAILGRYAGVPVHAHEDAGTALADRPFSSVAVVDLGDRAVELVHLGRGHTGGDVVVVVPDADVVVAGDLVGPVGEVPRYGPDCHPLEWPATLDLLLGLARPATVVVPGHGPVLDRAAVEEQRFDLGVVAETIADLAGRGVPLEEALRHPEWPFPVDRLQVAVRRGHAQLPHTPPATAPPLTARRLPLL